MVKAFGGQRESDGVVVPLIGVQHNAPGGKGPDFDHAGEVGKCEGMTGSARSNYPGRPSPAVVDGEPLVASSVKVRGLQRALWAAAKQSEGRRFHALYRTGNAAEKFVQVDRYVVRRLFRLMVKKRGRNLRAGKVDQWTES
jgi:hypothetical protein